MPTPRELVLNDIEILFSGSWQAGSVLISEQESSRHEDEDLNLKIIKSWETTKSEAELKGQKIWDSLVYRFENCLISNDCIKIQISTIPFSVRYEMNKFTEEIKMLGLSYSSKGMYASCLVKTKDEHFVFIEKSNKFVTTKKFAWVGGVLSKSEKEIKNGSDLFQAVSKEITEELGIDFDNISNFRLRIGYLTENWNFCLLFSLQTNLTRQEVQNKFNTHSDEEASQLVFIGADNIKSRINLFDSKDQKKFVLLELI